MEGDASDLEGREREFKRAKTDAVNVQRERAEEAHIRDQGRRMHGEREKAALAKNQATQHIQDSKHPAVDVGGIGELVCVAPWRRVL